MSASALPYRRSQPSWSKATPEEVTDQIFKFARRGLSPSQIGVILRDSHGVPQVKSVTGNKILRILKTNGQSEFSSRCDGSCGSSRWSEKGLAGAIRARQQGHGACAGKIAGGTENTIVCEQQLIIRSRPLHPRGPLPPHQKGRHCPKAP